MLQYFLAQIRRGQLLGQFHFSHIAYIPNSVSSFIKYPSSSVSRVARLAGAQWDFPQNSNHDSSWRKCLEVHGFPINAPIGNLKKSRCYS